MNTDSQSEQGAVPSIGEFAERMLESTPEYACPRCKDVFKPAFFLMCGGCLMDLIRVRRGESPVHFNHVDQAKVSS